MAQKNTKSVGSLILGQTKDYWINAAKQFIWPIDFTEKHILVPEKDLDAAMDNLMVSHFRSHGWHIQSAIVEYTKPYVAPENKGPMFTPIIKTEQAEQKFRIGQRFIVKSSECELQVIDIKKSFIELKYTNRNKQNISTNEDNLSKSLRFNYWVEV